MRTFQWLKYTVVVDKSEQKECSNYSVSEVQELDGLNQAWVEMDASRVDYVAMWSLKLCVILTQFWNY